MSNEDPPARYAQVRLGTLRSGVTVPFDVYAKVAGRYVRHTLGGDVLDQDRLLHLKEKGVRKLFIPADAEPLYLSYLDAALDKLGSSETSTESRATVAQAALTGLAQDAKQSLETEQSFSSATVRVEKIMDFLLSDRALVTDFIKSSGISQDVAQHSSTVSTLSLAVAERMGIKDKKDLLELALASLLHDVGKEESEASEQETAQKLNVDVTGPAHLNHPARGVEILSSKAFVSRAIRDLVRDHEELGGGAGFPDKKKLESLSLSQQILNTCNHFDAHCTREGVPPIEAGKNFFIEKIGLFRLDILNALSAAVRAKS